MNHQFDIKDDILTFSTSSFRAERGSVLHSGIYNREMASTLAAGACITVSGFFFAARTKITSVHFIFALGVFAVLFLFFRTYVFRDTVLHTKIDRAKRTVEIASENIFGKKSMSFPLGELDNIRQDYFSLSPENPDGVRIVEKIALQHGTVIPGFGEEAEFYTVELEFRSGRREVIFASKDPAEADGVAVKLENYIKEV